MTYLPDVNVWISLTLEEHVHQRAASDWFKSSAHDTIAFCRVTQMGFLRLLTNTRVLADKVYTPDGAWELLERFRRDKRIIYAQEPPGLDHAWRAMTSFHKTGTYFWTDTYLAAFAEMTGHTFVTFDRGFERYPGFALTVLGGTDS